MVCAEDVILWFKDAAAYRRLDVMCSLLNMCIPFELRFLGTCIEELGKHDYQELRGAAITANDIEKLSKELSSSKGLLETTTRHRLTIYLSLLQSHNYRCANLLYSSIFRNEQLDILIPNVLKDNNLHNELLLLYTMALNHPAFTFDQKTYFGDIVARLNEAEIPIQQQQQNISCPPGLGYFKPPLPVHHMPLVLKPSPTHTEIPGTPLPVPVNTVPNEFLPPHAVASPQMWPRPHYINTSCPPPPPPLPPPPVPEIPAFPPPVSPLVSQTSSPSQSRNVSPTRVYNVRQQPPHMIPPPQPQPPPPVMDRIPPIVKENISNPAFQPPIPSEEVEIEKTPWEPIALQPSTIKIPNGMLTIPNQTANQSHSHHQKLQPTNPISANYLANELQQLQLDEQLQCLSSSASSQSSESANQSPPDTPTDQPIIPPHGPGRGVKQNGGVGLPPGLPIPQQEIFPNCSVPYTTQYPGIPQFGNRSLSYYNQSYRPPFTPNDPNHPIIYNPFQYSYVTPVPFSSNVVNQPKATCYNCGLGGHLGQDCKESTIEEITQKQGYQIDYRTPPPDSNSSPSPNINTTQNTPLQNLPSTDKSNTNIQ